MRQKSFSKKENEKGAGSIKKEKEAKKKVKKEQMPMNLKEQGAQRKINLWTVVF